MKLLLSALLICSAVACKKKEEPAKTESAPAAKAESAAPAGSAAPADPAAAPAAPGQEAIDICGKIAKADVEAAVGKVTGEPEAMKAQGSMLGMCNWMTEAGMASVSARPAGEYDATVASVKNGKDVAGIGEKTNASDVGYLVKLAGKPYMLQVMVMNMQGKLDAAKSEALAKLAAAKL